MARFKLLIPPITAGEDGQALVEYGLILGLVAIAALVGLSVMGGGVDGLYAGIRTVAQTMADSLS